MDLVNEQHISRLQVGQDRGEVTLSLEHGAGCLTQIHAKFGGEDVGEGGLTEAGRPEDEHMIERLTAAACGIDEDPELLLDGRLTHIVRKAPRAYGAIKCLVLPDALRVDQSLVHAPTLVMIRNDRRFRRQRTAAPVG